MVWVEGEQSEQVNSLHQQSLGTVRLRSYLREEFTKDWISQMFLFHLVEFENEQKATEYRQLLGKEKGDRFARIFGSVDNIFYILIVRSTTKGKDDFETNESLQRLRLLKVQ